MSGPETIFFGCAKNLIFEPRREILMRANFVQINQYLIIMTKILRLIAISYMVPAPLTRETLRKQFR